MTSTSGGGQGDSYGYLNRSVITSDSIDPVMNLYGGEDRIWISPEGGQFSVFFDPGVEMSFANWRTPPCIDTEPFDVVAQDERSADFFRRVKLTTGADSPTT